MSENYSDPELDNNLLSILNQESMHSQPGPNQPNPIFYMLKGVVKIG